MSSSPEIDPYSTPTPSELSAMSAETCQWKFPDFAPLPTTNYKVECSVYADGYGYLTAEFRAKGGLKFALPLVDIVVARPPETSNCSLLQIFGESSDETLEWKYMVQMRFRTGGANSKTDKVVDGDIFELGKRCRPILLQLGDGKIRRLRIEIRFIDKIHDFLPKFDDGDIRLQFEGGSLEVHKAILAMHSRYLAERLVDVNEGDTVDMGNGDIIGFKEVLYQIYPTTRPIWANFKALAKAALEYRIDGILDKINTHLVNYEFMYLEQKISEAIKLELRDAIGALVYKAEQDGNWQKMVKNGLNAEKEFGSLVYNHIILPAVAKAKVEPYGKPFKEPFFANININKPRKFEEPYCVPLVVKGRTFMVNKGLLAVHNDKMFARGNNGEYLVSVSAELTQICQENETTVVELIEVLLEHIHPENHIIPVELVRPMLLLAFDHKMPKILADLERCLIDEPITSADHFLEHFELAERYNLENLFLNSLYRIERSCKRYLPTMVESERFKQLPVRTQEMIMDRYCSGWAVGKDYISSPTKRINRVVTLNEGGETNSNYEKDMKLATNQNANSDEAFGEEMEAVLAV